MNAYDILIYVLDLIDKAGGSRGDWHFELIATAPLAVSQEQGTSYIVAAETPVEAVMILDSLFGQGFRGTLPTEEVEGRLIHCRASAPLQET